MNNATQAALDQIGAISVTVVNTSNRFRKRVYKNIQSFCLARVCAPWYIYGGKNITGCVLNSFNVLICSLTNNFDRDGQFTFCTGLERSWRDISKSNETVLLEAINPNLCNGIDCGLGTCFVTSRNATFCQCASGVTGDRCNQRTYKRSDIPTRNRWPFVSFLVIQCNDVNCLNNGTCVRLASGFFQCVCAPGFGGAYCQYSKRVL